MRRRKLLLGVAATMLVATAGGVAVNTFGEAQADGGKEQQDGGLPQVTAEVSRGDLTSAVQVPGKLGFSAGRKISAGAEGVLAWLPKSGDTIGRSEKLYDVNEKSVYLMFGERPMYRELKTGNKGTDVQQLKQNLRALGYGNQLADDNEFTPGTAQAVKAWQKAKGLSQTGRIGAEQIVFAPGSLRVQKAEATVGDRLAPGKPVFSATGAGRVVTFDMKVAESGQHKTGDKVTIKLPDGTEASGKISSIGKSAEESTPDGQGGGGGDKTPKVKVTVEFDRPDRIKVIDQAPVTVSLSGESRKNVLSVPVEALIALPGRGFGVQVVENGKVREVLVELGLFANGRVEVSGGGIAEGEKVGVPK
ncbi:peptidoglycan-binding protein [Streptomyces sp. H27-C3]|uniref:efflux RND transporter periplasmic adaptor subunit n=1 Tax=Streptomyces sp. H27-C3 TaxID=3046305 RepID=UPI0024B8AC49|nr:peptidoglycan-binding protein [Streptomyces sp. H27-C3]MDJ0466217.1 peptidoglycan-binding protein [Streptomyces sp. H27-C3]